MKILFFFILATSCTSTSSHKNLIYDGYANVEHSTKDNVQIVKFIKQTSVSNENLLSMAFLYEYKYCQKNKQLPALHETKLKGDFLDQKFSCTSESLPELENYLTLELHKICGTDYTWEVLKEDCNKFYSKTIQSSIHKLK